MTQWQALAEQQPIVPGVFAYGLKFTNENNLYTFRFNANDAAQRAYITFYDNEGNEVTSIEVPNVVKGENSIEIDCKSLPAQSGDQLHWSVTLEGDPITTIRRINPLEQNYSGQLFVAVDKSPTSPKMGTIYTGNRVGSANASNGVYVCDVMGQRVDDNLYRGGHDWGSNYRMALDASGKLYVPDWGDGASGVFIADPLHMDANWTEFFQGTRNSVGLIVNDGTNVGSSTPGVAIGGTGADTKLYVYLEDFGNGVGVYNIGQPDGSVVDTWATSPSQYFDVGYLQLNTNGNVVADAQGRGVWIAQYRAADKNDASVPSLIFVDRDGNLTFNSGRAPYIDMLNGSDRSGFAVNDACDMLVVNDGSGILQFYDLTWEGTTPSIAPKYSYKADARNTAGSIFQMAFDYAGNLVCAGGNIGIYSLPTDDNIHTTPACGDYESFVIPSAVNEVDAEKIITSERYFDIRGIEYRQPIDGVNIIVRTYSDGTTTSIKVIK